MHDNILGLSTRDWETDIQRGNLSVSSYAKEASLDQNGKLYSNFDNFFPWKLKLFWRQSLCVTNVHAGNLGSAALDLEPMNKLPEGQVL